MLRSHLSALAPVLLWMVSAVSGQSAQPGLGSELAAYPSCALPCFVEAFTDGPCSPGNTTCACASETFQETVTLCVRASCSIPEVLATKNASQTSCGAPIRNRSGELQVISVTLVSVAAVCTFIRLGYKVLLARTDLGLDDWLVLCTLIIALPSPVIFVHGATKNGLGQDTWTLTPEQVSNCLKYFYVTACIYFCAVTVGKLAFIAFYLRVFPGRNSQRLLWGTFIFTLLWGTIYVLIAIFQCTPIHHFWTQWDGMHQGKCVSRNAISWSNAVINIALDVWILAIPMWQVRKLDLHWKKKIGVAFMFLIGAFVTIVSMIRLQSLVNIGNAHNPTWDFFNISVWSTIEVAVGIMCLCLPTIRLVLVRLFPILGASTNRSRSDQYLQYAKARIVRVGRPGTSGKVTVESMHSDPELGARIVIEKSYDVQFSDDEANLVPAKLVPAKH